MRGWRERFASEAVTRRLAELEQRDPEVRVLRLILGELKLYEWALSIGTIRDPVLRALAAPLPPEALRRITAEESPELFLWTGLVDADALLRLWQEHARTTERARPRLLDFGCGCGRLLRYLTAHGDLFELHGTDVNVEHVAWCREALAPIHFAVNATQPPLRYPAGHFDGIWSLSVFTHLDENDGLAWRTELARVLAPGGILMATTHGATAISRIEGDPGLAAMTRLTAEELRAVRRRTAEEGFAFVPYGADDLGAARAGPNYGLSFVSAEHIARRWADERLELVAHLPGGLRGWQDIAVFRRR